MGCLLPATSVMRVPEEQFVALGAGGNLEHSLFTVPQCIATGELGPRGMKRYALRCPKFSHLVQ